MILLDEFEMIDQEWNSEAFADFAEEIDDFTGEQLNELKYIGINPRLKTKVIHQILRMSENLKAFCTQKQILLNNLNFLQFLEEDIDPTELTEILK